MSEPQGDQLPERSQIVQLRLRDAGLTSMVRELPESTHTALAAAAALGCEVGAIASSLLFLVDDRPVLVMTSGAHRVDTGLLAAGIGAETITMAPAKLVRAITGQPIGGVAPVGHPTKLRTLVDRALGSYKTVWAAAGTPHTVMPLTFDQLISLTAGEVVAVAEKPEGPTDGEGA